MTPALLLAELRHRGATVYARGDRLVIDAPAGTLTAELRQDLTALKPELLTLLANTPTSRGSSAFDADAGELAVVKLRNTAIGDLWLVADAEALAEHPDIIWAGLPVFFFDEVEQLRGKTPAELASDRNGQDDLPDLTGAAMTDRFQAFAVATRLDQGAVTYGNGGFQRNSAELAGEIEHEGWPR